MDSAREEEIKQIICTYRSDSCAEDYFNKLQDLGNNLRKSERINQLCSFLNALGNKDRLTIVKVLQEGEQCVCELEAILDKSQPSISHHLRNLERIGLIRGWKKGKFTFYELRKEEFNKYSDIFHKEFNF